uniref:Beta-defensin n=1 Tax=Anser brachyrhynchus TaxID=132585 RepID=A0A8B9BFR8_9AVES
MRFLCLILAVFLLVSLAAPGYGQVRKYCPWGGYCSRKCSKADVWSLSSDCKFYCCLRLIWKGK